MRVLVWQWGRRGAGPRVAAELACAFAAEDGATSLLSLAAGAELLRAAAPPPCDLAFPTYDGVATFVLRALRTPMLVPRLASWVQDQRVDVALCAMPAALDFVMAAALRRARVPFAVVVHDADPHPGDVFPAQIHLQRRLLSRAAGAIALSSHVAGRLREQGLPSGRLLMTGALPPFAFGPPPPPPGTHGGPLRLLSFGRLLPYKGLDLLAEGLARLGPRPDMELRVVGQGPHSPVLDQLAALPGVTIENRWVPEDEVGSLLAWSDALVLSHREASQSGVAAAAIAARRWIVATRVGGLEEQLRDVGGALLCEPDADSLAAALRRLLDPAAPRLPMPARDAHAWHGVSARMLTALAGLLQRTPA